MASLPAHIGPGGPTARSMAGAEKPPPAGSPLSDYLAAKSTPGPPSAVETLSKAAILAHCACGDCRSRRALEATE